MRRTKHWSCRRHFFHPRHHPCRRYRSAGLSRRHKNKRPRSSSSISSSSSSSNNNSAIKLHDLGTHRLRRRASHHSRFLDADSQRCRRLGRRRRMATSLCLFRVCFGDRQSRSFGPPPGSRLHAHPSQPRQAGVASGNTCRRDPECRICDVRRHQTEEAGVPQASTSAEQLGLQDDHHVGATLVPEHRHALVSNIPLL